MNTFNVVALLGSFLVVSIGAAAVTPTASTESQYDICHGLQCPNFTVLNKTADWELRRYGPTKWASTNTTSMYRDDVTRQMFWLLFQYISQDNAARKW
ncbi:heme-binding protein 2-like [Elysia marginata]|uniref:Heme-binding protein 2-like n=1 Tax=Elysia marginata TaxID=1093978 RepID=A0AAV4I5H5_9GAST|nr:heme-binding protein 2-like [Elysia marginata]